MMHYSRYVDNNLCTAAMAVSNYASTDVANHVTCRECWAIGVERIRRRGLVRKQLYDLIHFSGMAHQKPFSATKHAKNFV